MASYSCASTIHKTLSGSTVDTVTLTGSDINWIEIVNRGSTNLSVTFGGTTPADPVADADGTEVVFPNEAVTFDNGARVIKILGSGNAYDVSVGR